MSITTYKYIKDSPRVVASLKMSYHDWLILEKSTLWGLLEKYIEEVQNKQPQMSQKEKKGGNIC